MSVLSSILSGDKVRALIFDDHPKYENTNSKERGIFYTFSNTKLSDMCLSSIFGSYSCICSSRLICHIYYSNFAKHQKFKFNFFQLGQNEEQKIWVRIAEIMYSTNIYQISSNVLSLMKRNSVVCTPTLKIEGKTMNQIFEWLSIFCNTSKVPSLSFVYVHHVHEL